MVTLRKILRSAINYSDGTSAQTLVDDGMEPLKALAQVVMDNFNDAMTGTIIPDKKGTKYNDLAKRYGGELSDLIGPFVIVPVGGKNSDNFDVVDTFTGKVEASFRV